MRAEKPETHGHRRNPQPPGNFVSGVLQHIAQQAYLPKIGRKLPNRFRHVRAHFAAGEALFRIIFSRCDVASESLLPRAAGFFERKESSVTPLADHIDGGVGRYARNPGVQVVAVFLRIADKLFQAGHHFQESVLAHIFRVGGIAGQAQRPQVQARSVGQYQPGERFTVAPSRLQEQRGSSRAIQEQRCAAHDGRWSGRRIATVYSVVNYRN